MSDDGRKSVAVVSMARSDFTLYLPILRELERRPNFDCRFIVSGAHFSEAYGKTVDSIRAAGVRVDEELPFATVGSEPTDLGAAVGRGVEQFSRYFSERRPTFVMLLGDRLEMLAPALAAIAPGIPLVHIHGGELTLGALDNQVRHALTKLSHLHFTATAEYAARVISMGEEPWRVVVSGAPALDMIATATVQTAVEFKETFGLSPTERFLLVTLHPTTIGNEDPTSSCRALIGALDSWTEGVLVTAPNADPGNEIIRAELDRFCAGRPSARFVPDLGPVNYFAALSHAAAMVGNSSSGILEAPSYKLPVVNIGSRQEGRTRAANVIDVEPNAKSITAGIARATSTEFKDGIKTLVSPFGDGRAAERIADTLESVTPGERLMKKFFFEGQ